MTDEEIVDEYADSRRYAVTWGHVGDAYGQFEPLADAYFKLKRQVDLLVRGIERLSDVTPDDPDAP